MLLREVLRASSGAQPGEPSCPGIAIAGSRRGRGSTNPVFLVSAGSRGTTRHDGEPGSVRRRKIGTVTLSGKLMLQIIYIVSLNLKNSKLYNTPRHISAWRAVAGPPVPRPGPQMGHGHLTGPPGVHCRCLPNCPAGGGAAVTEHEGMYSIRERRDPFRHRP